MANVLALFGILFVFAICYPALLLLIWHTQPTATRAHERLARMPRRCAAFGFAATTLIAVPALILFGSASGAAQLLGWLTVLCALGLSAIGASGLAALLGARIHPGSQSPVLIGALALALATSFPVLGWIFALPAALFTSLGAATMALFSSPPRERAPATVSTPAAAQV